MSDLTAIDILINPDAASLEHAKKWNERMRQSEPHGFALDAQHAPHISLVQQYVGTADLDEVFAAVENTVADTDLPSISFTSAKIGHVGSSGGNTLAVVDLKPGPGVLDFQIRLIEAIAPFRGWGGTAAAYFTDAAEPDINEPTLHWIEHYVPEHSGDRFSAHITVGLAKEADIARIEAEPVAEFTVRPAGIAIFQLGNNGTARKELKAWKAT